MSEKPGSYEGAGTSKGVRAMKDRIAGMYSPPANVTIAQPPANDAPPRPTRDVEELRAMANAEQGAILLTWAIRLERALGPADSVDVREVIEEMRATGLALCPPTGASATGEALPQGKRVRCIALGSAYHGAIGTVREVDARPRGWHYLVQFDGFPPGADLSVRAAGDLEVLPDNAEGVRP